MPRRWTNPADSAPTSGNTSTPPPGSTTSTPVRVTLLRTGGLVGVHHEPTIEADGRWTYTAAASRETGRLPDAVTGRLHTLAGDPRLAAEAGASGRLPDCADGFRYQLTAGAVTAVHNGCADRSNPVSKEILGLLADNTPF
ncbi:MAG: hypothetical protein FWJ93_09715 [Micromonosporaceae bacterium]